MIIIIALCGGIIAGLAAARILDTIAKHRAAESNRT